MTNRPTPLTASASERLPKRKRRSHQRGAAMVEGVVAIPFFLLMFAGIVFVGKLYETKMRVMRFTKEAAWNYAMCNCNDKGDPISSTCRAAEGASAGSGGTDSAKPEGYDPSEVAKGGSGPGADLATKQLGSSYAQMESKVSADRFLGAYTKSVSSRTKVMCNETPHNGDIKGWGSAAFDAFSRW